MYFFIPPLFRISIVLIVSLTSFTLPFQLQPGQSIKPTTPKFESAPCMFPMPAGAIEGTDVECGYLSVPVRHSVPDGPTLQVAVAIVKSKDGNPKADPLFMAQGGPGGATIDTYVKTLLTESKLRSDRDIVLFDQRGTGFSKPSLKCPEYYTMIDQTIEKDLTLEESNKLNDQAMISCHDRLVQEGINLSAFNSLENAADIEALRTALGYEKINLYGVSYGTLLALHTLRDFPGGLRSVIIDSVVPPQTNFLTGAPKAENRSFTKLFTACSEDPACNHAYPQLEKVFFNLVDQLNNQPIHIPLTDTETGKKYNASLNGDGLLSAIFQMMYSTQLIPLLPKAIYEASQGNYSFIGNILSILTFDRTMSYGMYYSVICSEEANYKVKDINLDGIRPQIAKDEIANASDLLELCKKWNVEALDPQANRPVSSDIPVLVLGGEFDPITPPDYARQAAETLKNSFTVVFPSGGHGAATSGTCQDQTILNFLDNPQKAPDTTCLSDHKTPDFLTSSNTVMIPFLKNIANLEMNAIVTLILFSLSLLFLLSACLVWPIIWFVKFLRKSKTNVHWFGQLAHFAGIFTGLLTLIFFVVFFVVAIKMLMGNDFVFFYGFHASESWLFFLPLVIVVTSIILFIGTVLGWVKKYRSIWERIYDTLISISAVICLGILSYWGTVTALFVR